MTLPEATEVKNITATELPEAEKNGFHVGYQTETSPYPPLTGEGDAGTLFEQTDIKPEVDQLEPENPLKEINPADFDENLPDEPAGPAMEPERLPFEKYEQSARNAIMFIDVTQQIFLPWGYKNSLFKPGEFKKAKDLAKKYELAKQLQTDEAFTAADFQLIEKYKQAQDLINRVPFTDKEVKVLLEPLARVFEKYNVTLGPEAVLVSAAAYVIGPRLIPLFAKFD